MTDQTPRSVLLTGAAGFVGSQVARLALASGYHVIAPISPTSSRRRIADIEGDLQVIDADLRDLDSVIRTIDRATPPLCIHLAWHGWAGQADPEENLTSLALSLELIKRVTTAGAQRILAAGTCFEYDLAYGLLAEATTPLRPPNIYPLCKKAMYEIGMEFASDRSITFATPRLFYSYGPWEDTRRVVPTVIRTLLRGEAAEVTTGEQVRDYLHVSDVASAIWHVALSEQEGAVNIGSGEPVTIAELVETIGDIIGRPELIKRGAVPQRPGDPMKVLADATLLREELGWKPAYSLQEGLSDTISWWEKHGE